MNVMPAPGLAAWCSIVLRVGGRRLGWAALLLVLVLAPVLGQMHRIHHQAWRVAAAPNVPVLRADLASATAIAASATTGFSSALANKGLPGSLAYAQGHWLDRLFSHQVGDADCLALDQLGHDAPLQALSLAVLGPGLSHFLPWWLDATLVAATAAPCQARAPPFSR